MSNENGLNQMLKKYYDKSGKCILQRESVHHLKIKHFEEKDNQIYVRVAIAYYVMATLFHGLAIYVINVSNKSVLSAIYK